jgi:hypothetical protein
MLHSCRRRAAVEKVERGSGYRACETGHFSLDHISPERKVSKQRREQHSTE